VTLRDGGHAVKFDWPMELAQTYYRTLTSIDDVNFIELGYWGQTAKSTNKFYKLDMDVVNEVTQGSGKGNVSIMIDYHYCSHNVEDYPTAKQSEVGMIRMCSRKQDIDKALEFGRDLKNHTGLSVSLNVFNATNYSRDELLRIAHKVEPYPFDFVYFADTHGSLYLREDFGTFEEAISVLKGSGKKIGMHLHDHSGKAYLNFSMLESLGFDSSDTSVRGMGKGSGNLRLEYVVDKKNLVGLASFILENEEILTMHPHPYELITAKYSLTDNYAKQGKDMGMDIELFDAICSEISGLDKDTYDREILIRGQVR